MRGMRSAPLLILMLLALVGCQTAARAAPPAGELVQADLLAEPGVIAPGQTFWVGVRLRMKEHWHTYWRNPGELGRSHRHHLAATRGLHRRPDPMAYAASHPGRPARQLRL